MRRASPRASHGMLHWIFQKGNERVTCRVDHDDAAPRCTVALIPHTDLEATIVERFESGMRALQRHASIAARLRQLGWTLIAYTGDTALPKKDCQPAVA